MSDASQWRVLHRIKPSHWKALVHLVDVTEGGINEFQIFCGIAEKMKQQHVTKSIKKGKSYLKVVISLGAVKFPLYPVTQLHSHYQV